MVYLIRMTKTGSTNYQPAMRIARMLPDSKHSAEQRYAKACILRTTDALQLGLEESRLVQEIWGLKCPEIWLRRTEERLLLLTWVRVLGENHVEAAEPRAFMRDLLTSPWLIPTRVSEEEN